ncbi:FecR family protein [Chitinophaga nivalis]|uniref:FecR family protein n=1 Tax=Chitinophaga nivalis TaxID=2991709 RepID=A0ABT3IL99_9BACT|nr:FecR family protein [Chitinophaga nivalis]MCW3465588.1 FecR family protein [Chitinophaga nivalis]MCW3484721.1 FecR family protein [Chitinophaga nivalis]
MDQQERIWLLLGRKVSGEATMAELRELDDLLQHDPALRYKAAVLSNWQPPADADIWEEKTTRALEKQLQQIKATTAAATVDIALAGRKQWSGIRIAAVVVPALLLSCFAAFLLFHKRTPVINAERADVFANNGTRSRISLPDGTVVWLNGGSRLTYNPAMHTHDSRDVTLTGEAFFEVTQNAAKPFIIHTTKMDVKVLGTTFNVQAYPEDKTAATALVSGAVEVTFNDGAPRQIRLKPDQKLVLLGREGVMDKAEQLNRVAAFRMEKIHVNPEDSSIHEAAWRNNSLVFENESFEDIILKIERWYGIHVHLENRKLKNYRYTGTFKNESFREVLEALKVTTTFRYRVEDKDVFIYL